jgi:phosphatidylserine decarboxylase
MSALITALRLLPKNALSYAVGATLRTPWPQPMVQSIIRNFSKSYGVATEEAERDYLSYRTFNEFFTRRLKPGLRPLAPGEDVACSPVDGTVGQVGMIEDGTLVQAKGRRYTLAEFLVDPQDTKDYEGGTYLTLYLAPYNYHRIHTPLAGEITGFSHIPGHLWPVNAKGVAEIDRLFAVNERLITHMETRAGRIAIAKVGATCVGRIRATYEDLVTNDGPAEYRRVRYEKPIPIGRGEECGVFEMGSTVILLFQKGRFSPGAPVVPGEPIRMGQALGQFRAAQGS